MFSDGCVMGRMGEQRGGKQGGREDRGREVTTREEKLGVLTEERVDWERA